VAPTLTGNPVPGFPDLWQIRWRGREYVALRGFTADAEGIAEIARDWDADKLWDTLAITPEQRDVCMRWSIDKPSRETGLERPE
jgi:hypothetical protein